jgi:hypothetical protein
MDAVCHRWIMASVTTIKAFLFPAFGVSLTYTKYFPTCPLDGSTLAGSSEGNPNTA